MLKNLKYIRTLNPDPTELILEKIKTAEELYEHWSHYFYRDQTFMESLNRYERAVKVSNEVMDKMGTFKECYECSVLDQKGCCKAGLENEVTINIVFLNLLLKKEVPREREIPFKCFFVGPLGCKIFARPYLCREFFCKRIMDKLTQQQYAIITQTLNDELTLLYKVTSYIRSQLEFLLGDFLFELDIAGYC